MATGTREKLPFTRALCAALALTLCFVPMQGASSAGSAVKQSGLGRIAIVQTDDRRPTGLDVWSPV